jgi:two-component system phosphate regulon sensor histidine kinase PhoR
LILLVLDNLQVLQVFEQALTSKSYRVTIAPDRSSLDKAIQTTSPALLIVGEQFSDNTGLKLSGQISERFPTMPILFYAAHETTEIWHNAFQMGISDCFFPPLRSGDITQSVESALKKANRIGDWTRREVGRTTASLERRVNELQKMETILNHIEDGVIILDENNDLLLINPGARRIFGIGNKDVRKKNVFEVIPHADFRTLISMGTANLHENHEICIDEEQVYNARYASIPGIGVAVTIQNISNQKQVDRMKNEFVSMVSHDLRSPLTAILGYVELLDRVGPINDQQKEFIKRILANVKNVTTLTNDLLELGRIEAGIIGQVASVPLGVILNTSLENYQLRITERKIDLQVNIPAEIPLIRGNQVQIRQMLDNLLGNAYKYSPVGGKIEAGISIDGDQLILKISDSGPGIPLADQPHIFEKFYRGSNVSTEVDGSGLGLAIVKSIVDNHQGRIWVDSSHDKGTTFVVVFPIH